MANHRTETEIKPIICLLLLSDSLLRFCGRGTDNHSGNMNADKIASEARARIIWGEPALSVRDFLISNGVSSLDADAKLKELEVERTKEIRKIGLRNLLIGIVLTGAAAPTLYFSISIAGPSSGVIKALAFVMMAGVYGLAKLAKGVAYLVRPQCERGAIPDINNSDLIE